MKPHEQRVVDEKNDLDTKLTALVQFICASPIFNGLPYEDKQLLRGQRNCMVNYSDILGCRIARFQKGSTDEQAD